MGSSRIADRDTGPRNFVWNFRERRWQNRSLRSHGDCRVSPVDRYTTVKVIHKTTKRSFRRTHPRRRRLLTHLPVCAIKHNRDKKSSRFLTEEMSCERLETILFSYFLEKSRRKLASSKIGGSYCLRKIEFYYDYLSNNSNFFLPISARKSVLKSIVPNVVNKKNNHLLPFLSFR